MKETTYIDPKRHHRPEPEPPAPGRLTWTRLVLASFLTGGGRDVLGRQRPAVVFPAQLLDLAPGGVAIGVMGP